MPPPLQPGQMTSAFDEALKQVTTSNNDMINGYNSLVNALNSHGGVTGAAMALYLKDKVRDIRHAVEELDRIAKGLIEHSMPVVSLLLTSYDWNNQLFRPTTSIAGFAARKADDLVYWKGGAADAYNGNKIGPQADAAADLAAKVDFMSVWLFGIAQANLDFIKGMVAIFASFVKDITAAVIDAGSIVGALEAVGTLAGLCGSVLEQAINFPVTLLAKFVANLKSSRDATATMNNLVKLPGGHWPVAVYGAPS
jgi:hypothetical protein